MKRLTLLLLLLSLPSSAAPDLAAGRKLLAHYGWVCETSTVEMALALSPDLSSNPEVFYQQASEAVGLDLRPLAGQEITVVRYQLSRRTAVSQVPIYAHVAFHKKGIVGAWLSTAAPIAPGIAPIDERDFGKNF